MRLTPLLLPLFLFVTQPAAQESHGSLAPESQARIEQIFGAYDNLEGPGMSVAVYRDGKLAYARGFGLASVEHGVPNTPSTVFRIGSTSKQFTAACVVILSLMDELSLDDDIRKVLPEMPDYGAPITIRQMINHTSGLRDYIAIAEWMGHSVEGMSIAECFASVARQEGLGFRPGDTYQYSNSNYLLLGIIVARVSGQSLAEFAHENIFEPLGMHSTHFHDRHGHVVKQRALGYSPNRLGELELDLTKNDCVGDGGVFTTVEDMLKWDSNFYDEQLTGGLPFVESMLQRGILNDGSKLDYASGLIHGRLGSEPLVMHGGQWVGYLAELVRFPEQHLSIICLANRGDLNPTQLCMTVALELLGKSLGEAPRMLSRNQHPDPTPASSPDPKGQMRLTKAELAEFVGNYYSQELLFAWDIELRKGRLWLLTAQGKSVDLGQRGLDCFNNRRYQVQFQRDDEGITGYTLWIRGSGEFAFQRI